MVTFTFFLGVILGSLLVGPLAAYAGFVTGRYDQAEEEITELKVLRLEDLEEDE